MRMDADVDFELVGRDCHATHDGAVDLALAQNALYRVCRVAGARKVVVDYGPLPAEEVALRLLLDLRRFRGRLHLELAYLD